MVRLMLIEVHNITNYKYAKDNDKFKKDNTENKKEI